LQIISTVTTGWHYFTDVLGGFVVAGFGLVCAYWFERTEARWNARRAQAAVTALGQAADPQPETPAPAEPVLAG
jgi:predicted outer membrane lipoprotein